MNRKETLKKAEEVICNDRNKQYGSPEDNFGAIANLWSIYIQNKFKCQDIKLTGAMVADLMTLFKVGRNATADVAKEDTYIDICGYAACGCELACPDKNDDELGISPEVGKYYWLKPYSDVENHKYISKTVWNELCKTPVQIHGIAGYRTAFYVLGHDNFRWTFPNEAIAREATEEECARYKYTPQPALRFASSTLKRLHI